MVEKKPPKLANNHPKSALELVDYMGELIVSFDS
jgi:hypothetical protein